MHQVRSLVFIGSLLLAISCWGTRYVVAIEDNRSRISQLELGMSPNDVDRVMGVGTQFAYKAARVANPWRVDAFRLADGTSVRIQYYLTERPRNKARAQENELTPVVLENDRLVGWGWSYLKRMTDRYQISIPLEQR